MVRIMFINMEAFFYGLCYLSAFGKISIKVAALASSAASLISSTDASSLP
jgi:hypothetical protein